MITIVNYGLGNIGSIENMLKKIGVTEILVSSNHEEILKSDKLILPGVGSFDAGMEKINSSGLVNVLNEAVLINKVPILGICLGMQLMTKHSEEGEKSGFGWVDAETVKFDFNKQNIKVPHMGWNYVDILDNGLKANLPPNPKFYFVHSYFVKCNNIKDIMITCDYEGKFVAGFKKDNVMGVQFHPEKSHKHGMAFFRYFVENNF